MQLAATQRTHPPPVPPRPSRQIVAEALKKSTRPPCPTRQAPAPPPNQRPWRLEEQHEQEVYTYNAGRTIVYDSGQQPIKSQMETNDKEDPSSARRPASSDVSEEQHQFTSVNGMDHRELRIDDTAKRKDDKDSVSNNNSNDNGSDADNKNQCIGLESPESKSKTLESSSGNSSSSINNECKKKKCQNVRFKEEPESSVRVVENSGGGESYTNTKTARTEKCTTVVVIDDATADDRVSSKLSSCSQEEQNDRIQRQDWLEAGVHYSSTKITLSTAEEVSGSLMLNGFEHSQEEGQSQQFEFTDLDFSSILERIAMSSLQGLPPLPRSLSGFNLNGAGLIVEPPPPPPARSTSKTSQRAPKTPTSTTSSQGSRPSPQGRQLTTLDTQLAILRREMFGLRQLDLSLLSQLWSLNESIQEFRQLLQEQDDRAPSPSPSSEEGDDTSYGPGLTQPPPPPRRVAHPGIPHHQHQHHRAARPLTRSSKLPPSDESPSSEEYGAV